MDLTSRPLPPLIRLQFCPDQRALKDLGASELDFGFTNCPSTSSLSLSSNVATSFRNANNPKFTSLNRNTNGHAASPGDDYDGLTRGLSRMDISKSDGHFIGKSSSANLASVAFQVKIAYAGSNAMKSRGEEWRKEFWSVNPVSRLSPVPSSLLLNPFKQWEIPEEPIKTRYTFPPSDLLDSLINHYFSSVNTFLPVLHRPSFERSVALQLHHTDDDFGAIVLLVCALGARYSNDVRVKPDGIDDWQSSGWGWYNQVEAYRRTYYNTGSPTLYDLQFYCVCFSTLRLLLLRLTYCPFS